MSKHTGQGNGHPTEQKVLELWVQDKAAPIDAAADAETALKIQRLQEQMDDELVKEAPPLIAVGGVDEAKAYLPRIAPAEHRDHATLEVDKVQIAPVVDPRRAETEVIPRRVAEQIAQAEQAARQAEQTEKAAEQTTQPAEPAQPAQPAQPVRWALISGAAGLFGALLALLLWSLLSGGGPRATLREARPALSGVRSGLPSVAAESASAEPTAAPPMTSGTAEVMAPSASASTAPEITATAGAASSAGRAPIRSTKAKPFKGLNGLNE